MHNAIFAGRITEIEGAATTDSFELATIDGFAVLDIIKVYSPTVKSGSILHKNGDSDEKLSEIVLASAPPRVQTIFTAVTDPVFSNEMLQSLPTTQLSGSRKLTESASSTVKAPEVALTYLRRSRELCRAAPVTVYPSPGDSAPVTEASTRIFHHFAVSII